MILAMVVVLAPLPANEIAPPLDVPILQVQTEMRDDGRHRRTFRLERTLRFSMEPEGFRVLVTILSADAEAEAPERDNYRAANRGFVGLSFNVHLDRAGKLRSVDDLESVWTAWTAGLRAAQGNTANAAADAALQRLGALTLAQRMSMVGSIVTGTVAPLEERAPTPARAVSFASPPPFDRITLNGTTTAATVGDRTATRTTAAGSSPAGDARISFTNVHTVDPASGLITGATRRTTTSTRGGILTVETTQTLTW